MVHSLSIKRIEDVKILVPYDSIERINSLCYGPDGGEVEFMSKMNLRDTLSPIS